MHEDKDGPPWAGLKVLTAAEQCSTYSVIKEWADAKNSPDAVAFFYNDCKTDFSYNTHYQSIPWAGWCICTGAYPSMHWVGKAKPRNSV